MPSIRTVLAVATALFAVPIVGCGGGGSTPIARSAQTRIIQTGDRAVYSLTGDLNGTMTLTLARTGDDVTVTTKASLNTPVGPIEFEESEDFRQTDGDVLIKHIEGYALQIPRSFAPDATFTNVRTVCEEEDANGACVRTGTEEYAFTVTGTGLASVPAGTYETWVVQVREGTDTSTFQMAPQLGIFPVKVVGPGLTMVLKETNIR
ncbi:MAG: hypothetical protein ACKO5K_06470 [Armatimonadota bacterium]